MDINKPHEIQIEPIPRDEKLIKLMTLYLERFEKLNHAERGVYVDLFTVVTAPIMVIKND